MNASFHEKKTQDSSIVFSRYLFASTKNMKWETFVGRSWVTPSQKNLFLPRIQTKMEQVVSYELHKNMQINFTFLNPTILTQMDHDSLQMEYPPEK